MKTIVHILRLPWLARIPSGTGLTSTVLTALVLSALAVQQIRTLNGSQQLGVGVLVFAVMVVWTLAPSVLWLARDSNSLRVPGAEHEADRCLLLYAVLSILLPALMLGAIFGHALTWLVSLALVASALFSITVLPVWIAWGCVLACIALITMFASASHVPMPGDPDYLAWAVPVTVALFVVSLQRWRMLRHAELSDMNRWWIPGLEAQRAGGMRVLVGGTLTQSGQTRYASSQKSQTTQLSQLIGPDHPVRSIRLAISPFANPNAQRGIQCTILMGVPAAAVFLVLLVQQVFPATARAFIAHFLPMFAILFLGGGFGGFVTGTTTRWSDRHGELPLLALLPHLGTPTVARRATLLAGLQSTTVWSISVLIVATLIAAVTHEPVAIYPLLLVVAMSGLAFDATSVIYVMAGRSPHGAMRHIPKAALFALLIASVVLWAGAFPHDTTMSMSPHGEIWLYASVWLWAAWLLLLLALAWRGWNLLQQRPHPFLANPPR